MKQIVLCACALLFIFTASFIYRPTQVVRAQSTGCTEQALALAQGQLTDTLAYASGSQFPVSTNPANANKWSLAAASQWTSGFFPGLLWFEYEQTLNDSWFTRAENQTAGMLGQDVNASDHDIGFKIITSYGNAYRITRDPADLAVIQTAANAMATNLWRSGAGVIESWPNYDSHITVIIDNMMNLELLFFAAQNGGDPTWRDMAISHALKTMQNHVRTDGSTFHVVDYNPDGTVFSKFTVQGAGTNTTWSRGQAWGLYGFTMVYRYTQDARFLATAQQLADYFINNLPLDFVPYWDFSASGTSPRDSSAAAIAAAGLLELSTYASPVDSARYRAAALQIQSSLSSAAYLGDRASTDGTLLHGSANVPGNSGVDVSLIYGDYYFIQGCERARATPTAPANVTAAAESGGQINLTWDAQPGPIRYSVKRSSTSGGPYTTIAPPPILTANSYVDTGFALGSTYFYVVSALNASGESPNSAEVSAAASNPVPTIASISPMHVPAGTAFTLTVNGADFLPSSIINFGGIPQPTSLVSSTQLTGTIAATSANAGGTAVVTVSNGAPGGGTSAAINFLIDDFSISAPPGSVALSSGKSAAIVFTVAPSNANGFANPVIFNVSGLPTNISATFNPPSIIPASGSGTTTLTLTSSVQAQTVSPRFQSTKTRFSLLILWLAACLAAPIVALWYQPSAQRLAFVSANRALPSRGLLLLSVLIVSGCAGGGSATMPSTTPPPTISHLTVTVTAASGSDVKNMSILLAIQ